jgi:hypothetical protein
MRRFAAGVLCCIVALTACSEEEKLLKEKALLLDAFVFASDNIEDGKLEKFRFQPWKREVSGQTISFWTVGRNSYGFSDDETNKLTKNSKYVRYTEKISSPENCMFRKESHAEFSSGDSTTDFGVYDMGQDIVIFNLAKAYQFEILYDPPSADLNVRGPGVTCDPDGSCSNEWSKQIFPEDYWSYDQKPPSVLRREKAVELISPTFPTRREKLTISAQA